MEKITFNSDLSIRNKSLTYSQWIIFFQDERVVSFKFNYVIDLSVFRIYLCNIVSLIFGLSFYSFFVNSVLHFSNYFSLKIKKVNFQFSVMAIAILISSEFFSLCSLDFDLIIRNSKCVRTLSAIQTKQIVEEYLKFLTTTDLVMNLVTITPNLTLSLCFQDLLINFAPNYNLKTNEFTQMSDYQDDLPRHLENMSVQELVDWVDRISISQLFELRIQISSKFKFVNTLKENTRIFFRNGRFCFKIDLQLDKFVAKSKNRIKALVEQESYLYVKLNDTFDFFFLTTFLTFPHFTNQVLFCHLIES